MRVCLFLLAHRKRTIYTRTEEDRSRVACIEELHSEQEQIENLLMIIIIIITFSKRAEKTEEEEKNRKTKRIYSDENRFNRRDVQDTIG